MIDAQVRERVLAEVDALADDLVQMTIDTVRIPSVNPTYPGIDQEAASGGETRVNEFCKPLMEGVGLETDLWEAEAGRANLAGTLRGAGGGRSLLFNGHVDVVPPGPDGSRCSPAPAGSPHCSPTARQWSCCGWAGRTSPSRRHGRSETNATRRGPS